MANIDERIVNIFFAPAVVYPNAENYFTVEDLTKYVARWRTHPPSIQEALEKIRCSPPTR